MHIQTRCLARLPPTAAAGDIGTSPLYAFSAVFTGPPDEQAVLGATSLFFWTLTLLVRASAVSILAWRMQRHEKKGRVCMRCQWEQRRGVQAAPGAEELPTVAMTPALLPLGYRCWSNM